MTVKSINNLKSLKCHIFVTKHYLFLVILTSVDEQSEDEKIFMEEKLVKILKLLGLITNIEDYQKIYNHA